MLRHIRLVHTGTTHTETGMRTREVLQDSRALTLWFEALRVRSRCTTARVCTSVHSTNMQSRSGSSVHSSECLHSVYACLSQCLCAVRTYDHVYTLLFFSNHNLIACRDTKACSTQKEKSVSCHGVCCIQSVVLLLVYGVCGVRRERRQYARRQHMYGVCKTFFLLHMQQEKHAHLYALIAGSSSNV